MWSYKRCGPIVGWSLNKSLLGINFPRCAHSCPSIQLWFAPSYFPYYISTYDWSVTFRLSVGSEAAIDTLSPLSSYLWQNTESQCSDSQSTSRSPSSSEGAVHVFFSWLSAPPSRWRSLSVRVCRLLTCPSSLRRPVSLFLSSATETAHLSAGPSICLIGYLLCTSLSLMKSLRLSYFIPPRSLSLEAKPGLYPLTRGNFFFSMKRESSIPWEIV